MAAAPLGVEEARRRLPELLARAGAGETFVIQRHKTPLAALVPLDGQQAVEPAGQLSPHLMALQGSGRHCGARPPESAGPFRPSGLQVGSRISLDGSALVAFLRDTGGTGQLLKPLIQGIAQGTWLGVISSVSLAQVLEGPLAQGDEGLVQRYSQTFAHPRHWLQVPVDGALTLAAARLQRQDPRLDTIRAIELATAIAAEAAVLVTDHPVLAQTSRHPVLSAVRP